MDVTRVSQTDAVLARLRPAQALGLRAEARVHQNALKRALRHGFHSSLGNWGDFVTGTLLNSIFISDPEFTGDGASIKVGTPLIYALYWELGHHNIFTKHFERDEKWAPTFRATREQGLDAYARVFHRVLKGESVTLTFDIAPT